MSSDRLFQVREGKCPGGNVLHPRFTRTPSGSSENAFCHYCAYCSLQHDGQISAGASYSSGGLTSWAWPLTVDLVKFLCKERKRHFARGCPIFLQRLLRCIDCPSIVQSLLRFPRTWYSYITRKLPYRSRRNSATSWRSSATLMI